MVFRENCECRWAHRTIIFHETIDLREIADIHVGQNGKIVRHTSARIENVCEEAIRVAIQVRIFIEISVKNCLKCL